MHYKCSCGKTHHMGIDHLAIGKDALDRLPEFLADQKLHDGSMLSKGDTIMITADVHTWKVAGERVFHMVEDYGYQVAKYVFPHEKMHTEMKYIDEAGAHVPDDTKLMIAVGSGTINDITRYISFHRDIPYYIIGTAPSMDGYASDVSPVIIDNLKRSLPAHCASGIIGDSDILSTAPDKMIAAGVGDIMAKFLDVNDWKLSNIINGEPYCQEIAECMIKAADNTLQNIDGLVKRDPVAMQYLMEALVLSGIAMAYQGSSRPGSAAEHSMAHVMEMTSLLKGDYGELHGTCVGMATCVITKLYQKFLGIPIDYDRASEHARSFDYDRWVAEMKRFYTSAADPVIKLYDAKKRNDPEVVESRLASIKDHEDEIRQVVEETLVSSNKTEEAIAKLNGWVNPVQFGFSRDHMRGIIINSKEQRDRYAAIQFLYDIGELETFVEEVLDEYYGKEC